MSEQDEEKAFVTKVGPVAVDWPRTLGYFGGIGLAVAFDLIAPPLAFIIAAVPLLKLLKRKDATTAERAVAAVLEGAAKPVGGDSESCVRPRYMQEEKEREASEKKQPEATKRGAGDIPAMAS